jgi:hypothetical protein
MRPHHDDRAQPPRQAQVKLTATLKLSSMRHGSLWSLSRQ